MDQMNYNKTLNLPKTKFSMKANLNQREPEIQKFWKSSGVYDKFNEIDSAKGTFILHDGPPYANGHIHLGHSLNRILKDIIIRFKNISGYNTPFIPGWDCHGLPIEFELIKKTGRKAVENKVEFRKKAAEYAKKFVSIQKEEFSRIGLMGDWENPYLTLDPIYEERIIDIFSRLYLDGYIYRELKPVYWCSSCRTALAEAEVEYKELTSPSVFVRFAMEEELPEYVSNGLKTSILVWTTTPWTLPSNVALCFNAEFYYSFLTDGRENLVVASEFAGQYEGFKELGREKGSWFEGKKFNPPFSEKASAGVNGSFVTLEDGTGIVHIAPGHGTDDYITGKKYSLEVLSPVDAGGRFSDQVPLEEVRGMHVFESDPLIIEILAKKGLLFNKTDIAHSYPHCWRCKNPIVFRATKQWFLSIDEKGLRERVLASVRKVAWCPETAEKRITAMISTRPDWCLSRQRTWGVPIPIFYCSDCGEAFATEETFVRIKELVREKGTDIWFILDEKELLPEGSVCSCGSSEFIKENDILDVWFDSGVSSFAVLETRAETRWPADLYLEGSDQHRGWFQSSIIPSVAVRETAPYKTVLTHGFTKDTEGKKMSKSVGNTISPQDIIKKYGADILRLWVATEDYTTDVHISDEILQQMVTYYRRVRNTLRYILGNTFDMLPEELVAYGNLTSIDKYMLNKLYSLREEVLSYYNNYSFHKAVRLLHDFCNISLSSFYFNILKDRLYVEAQDSHLRRSSQTVLTYIGIELIKMLSPVLVHTSEEAWQKLKDENRFAASLMGDSVALSFFEALPEEWKNSSENPKWDYITELREHVLKQIEVAKEKSMAKDPLETEVCFAVDSDELKKWIENNLTDLKESFIVSSIAFAESADAEYEYVETSKGKLGIVVNRAAGTKCVRCWLVSETVGSSPEHPELCSRCTTVVKNHPAA